MLSTGGVIRGRKRRKLRGLALRGLAVFALSLALGCSEDGSRLSIQTRWASGEAPDFFAEGLRPFIRAQILDGATIVNASRSEPLSSGRVDLTGIPHGTGLTARVEVLDAAWLNASVLYAGVSAPFDLAVGTIVEREVVLAPVEDMPAPVSATVAVDRARLRYERAPWGRVFALAERPAGRAPEAAVIGAPGAAIGAAEVVVFSEPDIAKATQLDRRRVDDDGGFEATFVRPLANDRDRVAVAFADEDGRLTDFSSEPGLQALPIREVRWVANLIGKVPDSDFPNPHDLLIARRRATGRRLDPANLVLLDAATVAAATERDGGSVVASATRSWRSVSMALPSARTGPHFGYDEDADELVMYGGSTGTFAIVSDLWRWSTFGWREVEVEGDVPAPRVEAVFAYHRRLGGLLLYGGVDSRDEKEDLWLLQGNRWRPLEVKGPTPGPRAGMAHAYDTRRDLLFVFGGCGDEVRTGPRCTAVRDDLWAFDGETWRELMPEGPRPSSRTQAGLVYDEAGDRLLLIGGGLEFDNLRDDRFWSYSFETNTWTPILVPALFPPPMFFVKPVFDRVRGEVLIDGAINDAAQPLGLWRWDGSEWTRPWAGLSVPPRSSVGWAYHPRLGEAVSFGGAPRLGDRPEPVFRTWNGERWRLVHEGPVQPPSLAGAAMATRRADARVYLFGGQDLVNGELSADLWFFDGAGWQVSAAQGPPRRVYAGIADFDDTGLVLVGGLDDGRQPLGDVWRFDSEWIQVSPQGQGPEGSASAAFDRARGRLVVMGCDGVFYLTNDGGQFAWTQDAGAPEGRRHAAVTYDEAGERIVIAGGELCGATASLVDETWVFDASGWRSIAPPSGMVPFAHAALAYEPARAIAVRHGGLTRPQNPANPSDVREEIQSDIWELRVDTWQRAELVTAAPRRSEHQAAFDPVRGGIILFGGIGDGRGQTLRYDGRTVAAVTEPTEPGARCDPAAGYVNGAGVLHGGCSTLSLDRITGCQAVQGTWQWQGYGWRRQVSSVEPEPRYSAQTFVDLDQDRFYLVGGRDGNTLPTAVWSFDGTSWSFVQDAASIYFGAMAWGGAADTAYGVGGILNDASLPGAWRYQVAGPLEETSASLPSPRIRSRAAYDRARGQVIMFGGQLPLPAGLTNETCLRSEQGWSCLTADAAMGPAPRSGHEMAYDSARGRVVLAGGASEDLADDTWEWTGDRWHRISGRDFIHQQGFAMFFDPEREGLVAQGGYRIGACGSETSFLDLSPDTRPEIRVSVAFGSTREDTATIERVTLRWVGGGRGWSVNRTGAAVSQSGYRVEAWNVRRSEWEIIQTFADDVDAPAEQMLILETDLEADPHAYLTADETIEVRWVPTAGNGSGEAPAEVRLDAVEATVDYAW